MNRRTALSLAGLTGLSLVGSVRADEATDANKAVLTRYVDEVINGGNFDLLPDLVSDTYSTTDPELAPGIDALRARLESNRSNAELLYESLAYTLSNLVAEDEFVMGLGEIAATREGRNLKTNLMTAASFKDGKITTIWNVFDPTEMF